MKNLSFKHLSSSRGSVTWIEGAFVVIALIAGVTVYFKSIQPQVSLMERDINISATLQAATTIAPRVAEIDSSGNLTAAPQATVNTALLNFVQDLRNNSQRQGSNPQFEEFCAVAYPLGPLTNPACPGSTPPGLPIGQASTTGGTGNCGGNANANLANAVPQLRQQADPSCQRNTFAVVAVSESRDGFGVYNVSYDRVAYLAGGPGNNNNNSGTNPTGTNPGNGNCQNGQNPDGTCISVMQSSSESSESSSVSSEATCPSDQAPDGSGGCVCNNGQPPNGQGICLSTWGPPG